MKPMIRHLTIVACFAGILCGSTADAQEMDARDNVAQERFVFRPAVPEKAPRFDDAAPPATGSGTETPVVRGQTPLIRTAVDDEFRIMPPPPRGLVEPTAIPPQVTKPLELSEQSDDLYVASNPATDTPNTVAESGAGKKNETPAPTDGGRGAAIPDTAYMVLMLWAFVSTCLFAFSIFLFYDYRQRWIAALTTQNSRLVQSFEALTEGLTADGYGSDSPFRLEDGADQAAYGGVKFGEFPEFSFR